MLRLTIATAAFSFLVAHPVDAQSEELPPYDGDAVYNFCVNGGLFALQVMTLRQDDVPFGAATIRMQDIHGELAEWQHSLLHDAYTYRIRWLHSQQEQAVLDYGEEVSRRCR